MWKWRWPPGAETSIILGRPRRLCAAAGQAAPSAQRFRADGPRVELLPAGVPKMVGAGYIEAPGTDGPLVAWWRYEDTFVSVKVIRIGWPT